MNDLKFIINSFAVNITLNNFNFNRGRRIYIGYEKEMNNLKFILNSFAVNITLNNFNFNRGRRIYIGYENEKRKI